MILFILSASSLLALAAASPAISDMEIVEILVHSLVGDDLTEEDLAWLIEQIPVSEAMFQEKSVSEAMLQENAVEQADKSGM